MGITIEARKDCPHKLTRRAYTKLGYTETCFGCGMLRKTMVTKNAAGVVKKTSGDWYVKGQW